MAYLKVHYAHYLSLEEDEIVKIINKFFDDIPVNSALYITAREKLKKAVRTWVKNFEVFNLVVYLLKTSTDRRTCQCADEFKSPSLGRV
ncbi:hypothetical protein K440DRAFT_626350 [Wilcoxina mikolae CBS 423.85]|nr:hypothetical protein K440DRAFT_626350 [Wilcoxina mikolae CBS 423.85]